jgi:PAS domain S-box-containing protein
MAAVPNKSMNRETPPAVLNNERPAIAQALLARQVLTHRANVWLANVGSAFGAAVLVAMMWGAVPRAALLAWVALLAAVLGLRTLVSGFPPRAASEAELNREWLWRFRLGFLAHGIAWGLTSALPLPPGDALHLAFVIIVLAGVTASAFTLTAFDLIAALSFGVPVLGMLSVRLFLQADPTYWILGAAVIGVLIFLGVAARRMQQVVRKYESLRLAEAEQREALRSSEDLLERAGELAGVGGWELDVTSNALRLTLQAYRIHDNEPVAWPNVDAFIGLYAQPEQALIRADLAAAIEQGTPFDRELPLITPRGRALRVRLIGRPHLEDGKTVRVSGLVQDVTQARAAEQARAQQHHLMTLIVQTTREGFWFIDAAGITTGVNPAMCEILGRARDDIVGKGIFEFVDETNAAIFRDQVRRRAEGLASGYEIALTRADGSLVDCFNNATPIFDTAGKRTGAIGMFSDISEQKRAERRLRATSEQLSEKTRALQVTLDSIEQGILSYDSDGRVSVYNRRALELLDLPETLLSSRPTYDELVSYQDQRGELLKEATYIDADGVRRNFRAGPIDAPEVYVRRSHSGAMLEIRSRRFPGRGLVRTYADVTAHFEAQQAVRDSEAQIRSLLDAFPGYIVVDDVNSVYTYVNERVAALIGHPADAIIGRTILEMQGEARLAQIHALVALAKGGEAVTVESEYLATAHRPHTWLQVTHAVNADPATGRCDHYAFGIDISERKAAEQALMAARDEAERANRAKSQFLSSMSHELRTPMNAILGFAQLLGSDPRNPLAPQQSDHVREILRGARHLLSLINEVLDLALVETGKLKVSLEPMQVAELLQECLGLLQPLARESQIDVRVLDAATCDCLVVADRTRLKQVLLNLLSNAIKYNREGGHVHIACLPSAGVVRINVTDSGPGLSPEQGARLFQAFERLDAAQTAVEGAGLGLALSRQLLQAMGGEIGLASEAGRGSTFWIQLPRAEARDSVPDAGLQVPLVASAPPPPGQLRKVLYIEDNPVNVLLMEAMLARAQNLQVITAPLPMLGLQMAVDERPDLILLDIQLPGMDGFEVLRRLRLGAATCAIPVIAVSANAMDGDVKRGLEAGFARYLTKPLELHQLLAAVEATFAVA